MIVMGKVVSKSKFLPNFLKKIINLILPRRVRVITGSIPQDPNKHLAKNFFGLTSLFVELFKTDIKFAEEDFTMIENVLLKPREELRLRADI